jgi:hypothetical protein
LGNIPNKKYIELNVLIEKLIEKLLDIRGFKTLAHIGPSDILWEELFLNNIKHSRYLKNAKYAKKWGSTLATYAYPIMDSLNVNVVDRSYIMQVLEPIWRHKIEAELISMFKKNVIDKYFK